MQKLLLKGIIGSVIGLGAHGLLYAGVLDFVDIQQASLINNYTSLHFNTSGNDFQGGIFRLPSVQLDTPITLTYTDKSITCTRQIRGIYYNSQRGERIWPLDQITLGGLQAAKPEYNTLSLGGGRYTACTNDLYGIYGQITLNDGGIVSIVSAGVRMDRQLNTMSPISSFSLQYFDNKTPIGFMYDSIGGISFVGGGLIGGYGDIISLLNSGRSINQIFRYSGSTLLASGSYSVYFLDTPSLFQGLNTLFSLGIRGVASFNEEQLARGNDTKSSVFNQQASVSTVLNAVSQRAHQLCQGSKRYPRQQFEEAWKDNTIVCVEKSLTDGYSPEEYVMINLSDVDQYRGKIFVIKGVNVVLSNSMQGINPTPLNIFIDRGNILFDNDSKSLQHINAKGFYSDTVVATQGTYLVGNIFVNGIMAGIKDKKILPYTSKVYIHGRIASLNTASSVSDGRSKQIQSLFNNPEGMRKDILPFVSVSQSFNRTCDPIGGLGSDGVRCRDQDDQFTSSAFIIIDKQLSSPLVP